MKEDCYGQDHCSNVYFSMASENPLGQLSGVVQVKSMKTQTHPHCQFVTIVYQKKDS